MDPVRVCKALDLATKLDATSTVSTLLQQIWAAALAEAAKVGPGVLATVLNDVFTVLETSYPSVAELLVALQAILSNLLKPAPTPATP